MYALVKLREKFSTRPAVYASKQWPIFKDYCGISFTQRNNLRLYIKSRGKSLPQLPELSQRIQLS